ncbi:unnamed protein product [Mytilus edulis]|uniref:Uncharacterized protein n=1 Tax=Mytilus edulis TaxID=6550 RepID=A0A8S3RV01_MYTED|nr:unnamed protein product [Mytilus edulis]
MRRIPLLPYTANLGYTLTFGVDVQSKAPIKDLRFLLQVMKLEILNQLGKHLNRSMFPFLEMLIMKVNNTYSSKENIIGSYLHISVFLKLFVNVVVNRDEFETKLLQFHYQEFLFKRFLCSRLNTTINCIVKCRVKSDNGSLYLPIDLPFRRFHTTKYYLKTKNEIPGSKKYIHSHISSLLKCSQIELDKTEVIIDESKNLLRVPQYSTVSDYYNFYFTSSDRNVRICLNTFKSMMVSSSEMSVLQIIMLIFTTLSLLCLFLTFMTYCMFEQLRTLPGKNNMCLVVALFFAMAVLEFAHSIATTPKLKSYDSFRHNSVNLAVYIKLFTITGSSWVLQIIDSFLPLSPFSVIVSLLNAMQGIYIFVAYICNKRVFILYRSLICNKHVIRSDSESRTVTQTTSLTSTKLLK